MHSLVWNLRKKNRRKEMKIKKKEWDERSFETWFWLCCLPRWCCSSFQLNVFKNLNCVVTTVTFNKRHIIVILDRVTVYDVPENSTTSISIQCEVVLCAPWNLIHLYCKINWYMRRICLTEFQTRWPVTFVPVPLINLLLSPIHCFIWLLYQIVFAVDKINASLDLTNHSNNSELTE